MGQGVGVTRGEGNSRCLAGGWLYLALFGSRSPEPIEGPLRNSRVWGRDTPPIPLLRPFDSAHASAHLRQGERNAPPPGMERPYLVSRFRGEDDGYAKVSSRERVLGLPSAARNRGYAKVSSRERGDCLSLGTRSCLSSNPRVPCGFGLTTNRV